MSGSICLYSTMVLWTVSAAVSCSTTPHSSSTQTPQRRGVKKTDKDASLLELLDAHFADRGEVPRRCLVFLNNKHVVTLAGSRIARALGALPETDCHREELFCRWRWRRRRRRRYDHLTSLTISSCHCRKDRFLQKCQCTHKDDGLPRRGPGDSGCSANPADGLGAAGKIVLQRRAPPARPMTADEEKDMDRKHQTEVRRWKCSCCLMTVLCGWCFFHVVLC